MPLSSLTGYARTDDDVTFGRLFVSVFIIGTVLDIDALACGWVCGALGAARSRASDPILPGVGLELLVTVGHPIEKGQAWANLHHDSLPVAGDLMLKLQNAIVVATPTQSNTILSLRTRSRILEIVD